MTTMHCRPAVPEPGRRGEASRLYVRAVASLRNVVVVLASFFLLAVG